MLKKYRIKDIFIKAEGTAVSNLKDCTKNFSSKFCIPVISGEDIAGYAEKDACLSPAKGCIIVSPNKAGGGKCVYHPEEVATSGETYAVKLAGKEIEDHDAGLYFAFVLGKAVSGRDAGWESIKDAEIELPVVESTKSTENAEGKDKLGVYSVCDIDYEYIKSFVSMARGMFGAGEKNSTGKSPVARQESFRICDVMEKISVPNIKACARDFPAERSDDFCIPLLTSGAQNHGLSRYARPDDCPKILKNCISVAANGSAGTCFYQPNDFAVLQDAYAIKPIDREIESMEEGLYLAGVLNTALRVNHDWKYKAGWTKIKDEKIMLPVIENLDVSHKYTRDDIDWEYMKTSMLELEKKAIKKKEEKERKEISEYIRRADLGFLGLTEEDRMLLSLPSPVKLYKIGDIFEKIDSPGIKGNARDFPKERSDEFCVPLLTSGAQNHGLSRYARPEDCPQILKNCISVAANGSAGTCFYQAEEFAVLQDAYAIKLIGREIKTREEGVYLAGLLCKTLKEKYNWSNKATWNRIKNEKIELPVAPDGSIDFEYMENYIKAQEKLVVLKIKEKQKEELKKMRRIVFSENVC